jgi:hypothetical protein
MGWVVNATLWPRDPVTIAHKGCVPRQVWNGADNLAYTGNRSPNGAGLGESLYRLSYPGLLHSYNTVKRNWITVSNASKWHFVRHTHTHTHTVRCHAKHEVASKDVIQCQWVKHRKKNCLTSTVKELRSFETSVTTQYTWIFRNVTILT